VAATARRPETLAELPDRYGDRVLPLALDVTDKAAVDAAVAQAHRHFGRLDVVVNNAGYGLFGTIEEVSEAQARAQIETNLFGALWVTKAALPILREQGAGHIIQVSSIGGVNAFPTVGLYHASKWGLEGFSQALAQEVADFGIKVTLVEPTGYSTDWAGPSAVQAERLPVYAAVWERRAAWAAAMRRGDPEATGPAILELVDTEEPPLRIFFGDGPLAMIKAEYAKRLDEWEAWNDVSVRAHGGVAA
jgi:NAD(P)-dependent dehydrogenase (short-subunit alcohol dehydrogenase family)